MHAAVYMRYLLSDPILLRLRRVVNFADVYRERIGFRERMNAIE